MSFQENVKTRYFECWKKCKICILEHCSRYNSTLNNSKTVQDRAILTIVDQQKVVYGLSNGAIFNDLEQPLTQFFNSCHYLTLNISETVWDKELQWNNNSHFEWSWVTLSDLAKHSIIQSIARSLFCDFWASCLSYITASGHDTTCRGLVSGTSFLNDAMRYYGNDCDA